MEDLKVTVKSPCTASKDTMYSVGENCDFCTVCSTKVYDFTNATAEEFLEIYNKNNGDICSQAKVDEKGNFIFVEPQTPKSKWRTWAFSLLAFLGLSVSNTSCVSEREQIMGKMEMIHEEKDSVDITIQPEVKDTQKVEVVRQVKGKTKPKPKPPIIVGQVEMPKTKPPTKPPVDPEVVKGLPAKED